VARNPFPGLRPFESDEDHLFFGREADIDALLSRLRATRFLAVVGTSGSGKSSLVRSGLIPSLQSGFMAGAGSSWRIAVLRPGEDPIGNLAAAADAPGVLATDDAELADMHRVLLEATLRRGTLGLANAVRQARIPSDHNLLIVVDQFEELFRFRRSRHANSRDEAIAFVRLLLEAAAQHDLPIYIVLTMRSDFIGDCMNFPGLAEAVNAGLYLVGRMSRDSLRSAITGPVAVAGGTITPRLVNRVLNDLGDDQDQLPLVQHALMRTWEHWAEHRQRAGPIDLEDYEAIGTFKDALSRHAEEACQEATDPVDRATIERVFKALTDTHSDPRGVRRPTTVAELAEICERDEAAVIRIVDIFRRPGRSFLMPPPTVPLSSGSIIDLSHESLMRCWTRLIAWAEQEAAAGDFYLRLSRAASWNEAGKAGLWRNPELRLAERWRHETCPSAAWARRYDENFASAMAFLDRSLEEHRRLTAEAEHERRAKLRRTQWTAAVLATLLIAAVALAIVARRENARATANLALAREAVDESLSSVDLDPARLGADVPALEELRRDLLLKAQRFYAAIGAQDPDSEQSRDDLALAHLRLGHISRLLQRPEDAAREYTDAISRFERLAAASPAAPAYRQSLADANNWLAEVYRPQPGRAGDAERAYNRALALQEALVEAEPGNVEYARQMARTYYNRGILRSGAADSAPAAESDFRNAIRLLQPHSDRDAQSAQELARAFNNLAGGLSVDPARMDEARGLYEKAVEIDERLVREAPDNREYKLELAKFCNNLAALLQDLGRQEAADARSRRAVELIDELARLAPSLAVERGDARTLRGHILLSQKPAAAVREYAEALAIFEPMFDDARASRTPEFHQRYSDLLLDLAAFPANGPEGDQARRLLDRAIRRYGDATVSLSANGSVADAQTAVDTLSRVLPQLPAAERTRLAPALEQLRRRLPASR
jgi:tetratricopeptide (TPR) repeat protein/energy-coupling factor transporter ATP-binding protein EcfA2